MRGSCPVVATVQYDHLSMMRKLLADPRVGVGDIVTSSGGHTLLHWAVMCGNIQALADLMTVEGVDVNVRNAAGETPLMLAVKCKNAVAVETLLRNDEVSN